ncbi:hypothetical protein [Thiofilum flexile]|uniref:hypothetical protein n=1 Tax=Thiofilum flexile TaxID=125627 RepID=UPI00037B1A38|nr:hypothetical protein [Thiofilum flexile]
MDGLQYLFAYCERGSDISTWAEPLNVVTTGLWFIVGIWLWILVRTQGLSYQRPVVQYVLALLIILIGMADFGVHTQDKRMDKGLLFLFLLTFSALYTYLALTRFLRLQHRAALIITLGLSLLGSLMTILPCKLGYCLPPSALGLFPLILLLVMTRLLYQRNHPATRWLAGASALLAWGLVFNVLDQPLCQVTLLNEGYVLGWHYLWHILSAIAMFLLTQAMIQFYRYSPIGK